MVTNDGKKPKIGAMYEIINPDGFVTIREPSGKNSFITNRYGARLEKGHICQLVDICYDSFDYEDEVTWYKVFSGMHLGWVLLWANAKIDSKGTIHTKGNFLFDKTFKELVPPESSFSEDDGDDNKFIITEDSDTL